MTVPRRAAPLALALLASTALAAPAVAKNAPPQQPAAGAADAVISVDAVRDSVSVSGLAAGQAAQVEVRRAGVLIGVYSDNAEGALPLTVNTFAPSATKKSGDCWERGVLPVGLTPDIRPLDVVSVAGGPSMTVPADAPSAAAGVLGGPIGGCSALAAFALNAVQSASPATVIAGSAADLVLSGVAQPLATAVSVSLTDGTNTTAPVTAALAAGAWKATIPAAALDRLANGALTANAVYTVPDVGTGAPSQIAGAPLTLTKAAPAANAARPAATAPSIQRPAAAPSRPLRAVRVATRSRVSLAAARRNGLRVTITAPAGAKVARLELKHAGRTVVRRTVRVHRGTQSVRLSGAHLRKGTYRLVVRLGSATGGLGQATVKLVRIR